QSFTGPVSRGVPPQRQWGIRRLFVKRIAVANRRAFVRPPLVGLKACGHLLTWKQRELIQGSSGQSRVVDLSSPSNLVQHTVVACTARQKIVLADDNAYTREQVRRLLAGDYEVFA